MISKLIKIVFWLIIILIIFAFLPKSVLSKLKSYFNWDIFLKTLKAGFDNLINFLREALGINFEQIFYKLKSALGIDLLAVWSDGKKFLANFFQKLANILK